MVSRCESLNRYDKPWHLLRLLLCRFFWKILSGRTWLAATKELDARAKKLGLGPKKKSKGQKKKSSHGQKTSMKKAGKKKSMKKSMKTSMKMRTINEKKNRPMILTLTKDHLLWKGPSP